MALVALLPIHRLLYHRNSRLDAPPPRARTRHRRTQARLSPVTALERQHTTRRA